jgi:hypothetical protein
VVVLSISATQVSTLYLFSDKIMISLSRKIPVQFPGTIVGLSLKRQSALSQLYLTIHMPISDKPYVYSIHEPGFRFLEKLRRAIAIRSALSVGGDRTSFRIRLVAVAIPKSTIFQTQ